MSAFDTLTEIVRDLARGDHAAVAEGFAVLDGDETVTVEDSDDALTTETE